MGLQVRRHALAVTATVLAVGAVAAGSIALGVWRARRRNTLTARGGRLREAVGRMIDRPERVASEPTVMQRILGGGGLSREALPEKPLVVRIELTDVRGSAARHYLLLRRSEVSLCTTNPGYPEEVVLRTDRRTLIGWWRGDLSFRQARQAGLVLEGRREWVRAFPDWFERYLFAAVAPAARAGTSLEAARRG